MPKIIRTTDFVAEVKDLARRGYTKADIAKKMTAKYSTNGKRICSKTIRNALTEGSFRGKSS
ncbi:hypothetical protein [Leptospira santarosai]|uniref:hypothetical protein n=2 Tax=Leptospiraceae TaxID=170 RepID=UPI00062D04C2|nr:hypothetical protein [Leptospira santarosai]AVV80969.1 Uncharacterized protein XB15_03230 [Leptospira santarosai]OLY62398.1 hypothetical protein BWD11_20255 [Leptospira santarosai serovar Grippotyphosa]ONF75783.1 hypothetical protein BWD12_20165 [Leptospira santarosai serovar Bananal]